MDGKLRRTAIKKDGAQNKMLKNRLEFIKKRYRELILVPRERMMDGFRLEGGNEYEEEFELREIDVAYGLDSR